MCKPNWEAFSLMLRAGKGLQPSLTCLEAIVNITLDITEPVSWFLTLSVTAKDEMCKQLLNGTIDALRHCLWWWMFTQLMLFWFTVFLITRPCVGRTGLYSKSEQTTAARNRPVSQNPPKRQRRDEGYSSQTWASAFCHLNMLSDVVIIHLSTSCFLFSCLCQHNAIELESKSSPHT